MDREHEHGAGRQQEAVSDERRDHPDVQRHESHLRDHGSVTGVGEFGIVQLCFSNSDMTES